MTVEEEHECPYCKKPVTIIWTDKGIESSRDYVLVADWVYHSECWGKQVEEHPPWPLNERLD